MPYGVPDNIWSTLPLDARYNLQTAIEYARRTGGDVEAVKAQNLASVGGGTYTPEVSGEFAGAPVPYGSPADGGSGGSGSGGVARTSLASSPEWLAYLNALGLEQGQFTADIDRQRALAQSQADVAVQNLVPQFAQQRQGIAGSLESRGMARSGELLTDLSKSRQAEGIAQSGIQQGLASQQSSLESALAQKMIDINARKAQQQLQLLSSGSYF